MTDKDSAQTQLQKLPIQPGDTFTHYKRGGVYEIITLALQEDTLEPLVVYKNIDAHTVWVRTYNNFTEHVSDNGKLVRRFSPS